ncbi:hypothetical protein K438DRAFT_1783674 [Mycena galopus ATCC 62051]|nr:hypothetical protein K438DRAFT_1783674 [Mycena galopus ATCC 62051]
MDTLRWLKHSGRTREGGPDGVEEWAVREIGDCECAHGAAPRPGSAASARSTSYHEGVEAAHAYLYLARLGEHVRNAHVPDGTHGDALAAELRVEHREPEHAYTRTPTPNAYASRASAPAPSALHGAVIRTEHGRAGYWRGRAGQHMGDGWGKWREREDAWSRSRGSAGRGGNSYIISCCSMYLVVPRAMNAMPHFTSMSLYLPRFKSRHNEARDPGLNPGSRDFGAFTARLYTEFDS